ncbi:MAG: LysM domain-containing protein [Desulfomonilia bacterium]|nr:LysM domain-containing protein [Desulfomonilia bacterium]
MRRLLMGFLLGGFLAGCAVTEPVKPPLETVVQQPVKAEESTQGEILPDLQARDEQARAIMNTASVQLRKIVDISGFEYAKKESFALLITYLEMQRYYMDNDIEALKAHMEQFQAFVQKSQERTVAEKQRRLEDLGIEIAQRQEEIKKQGDSRILEAYTSIYVVKKGDTLPSIAARHEIYNESFMWPLIYKANRDQIKDPKIIYVGQDLKIPREMTMEEIIEARREAGAPEPEKIPKDAYTPRKK